MPLSESPRSLRWRVIPTALLAIFGGITFIVGMLMVIALPVMWLDEPKTSIERLFLPMACRSFGGLLWLFAARWCWQRRWLRFTIALVSGYLALAAVQLLEDAVR